ncbi:sorting nexin-17-like [Liolophura sinensis]|uniref:sorting nexin-17-like n=1 Tax=Liolophura sinensis TaxID=3198878 RepID=UPI0031581D82
MHFSIPDTQESKDENGTTYTCFNVHINGVFHCSVRYRQFHHFHEQLKKEFGSSILPPFPPKKLLALNSSQLEERRVMLERYIQIISQDATVCSSDTFNGFLLNAQQETAQEDPEAVSLDVFLMNGHKISVNILSTDQTEDVLENVASHIELADDFVYYFGLYLVKKEDGGDNSIVRKLQEFESPYISLRAANKEDSHRIVLRKSYWDPAFDDDLLEDRIAMNLLYVQAVSDIERQWTFATKDQLKQLTALQVKGSKREYLRFARTLKYYGFIQFRPCLTDYPEHNSRLLLSAGNKELNFRIQISSDQVKEGSFRITRMRCWRITTAGPENGDSDKRQSNSLSKLEIAFEYLVAKDTLKWITVQSDQAILISMCLQSMVDELIMKKQGKRIKRPQDRVKGSKYSYLKKNASSHQTDSSKQSVSGESDDHSAITKAVDSMKKISDKLSNVSMKRGANETGITENDAFEGIGDDDL